MSQLPIRFSATMLALAIAWYAPWMLLHSNPHALWLAVPFIAANLLLLLSLSVTAINNWTRSSPPDRVTVPGTEPRVAVVIPTAGESPGQVIRTAESVLEQSWPASHLWLIVSDDVHSEAMRSAVEALAVQHHAIQIDYFEPAARGSAERRGEAKAGNLNSVLEFIAASPVPFPFIETRDADDVVGDPTFLSRCIAQLRSDDSVAYVQTIKDAQVAPGDPFDNLQPHFFRGAMLARHAANAVFPCGSGLVWRAEALEDIGGFPTWNLVEDLQSGVEALRRGWRGVYLPIVGAVGQHAPEDIPVTYKQRGTWGLDTIRLQAWGDMRGLSLRQRLHFSELALFYLQSFSTLVFILSPVVSFVFQRYPLQTDLASYVLHFWPLAAALETFLAALNYPNRYETLWRARQLWVGLVFVYAKGTILAIAGGRSRKPTYKVTRKTHEFAWYWRETLPQVGLVVLLLGTLVYGALTTPLLTRFDLGSAYFALLYAELLLGFVRKGWFGVAPPFGPLRQRVRAVGPALTAAAGAVAALAFMVVLVGDGLPRASTVSSALALTAGCLGVVAAFGAIRPGAGRGSFMIGSAVACGAFAAATVAVAAA